MVNAFTNILAAFKVYLVISAPSYLTEDNPLISSAYGKNIRCNPGGV